MKTRLQIVLIAASSVLLAACASSGGVASAPAAGPQHSPDQIETDAAYVAAVERMARRRGVSVRWLNPPTKRVAVAEGGVEAQ